MQIGDYLDAARQRASLPSDGALARHLGLDRAVISFWRVGRSLPSDANMLRVADAAGVDRHAALADLNSWRSKDPTVRDCYTRLAARLRDVAAAIIAVAAVTWAAPDAANARATTAQGGGAIYTLCDKLRALAQGLRRLYPCRHTSHGGNQGRMRAWKPTREYRHACAA